ncbi:hemolysin family protein [Halobacillus sp. A5]|uniref:hemolysin family protein n=1 Tax=Halobacillus sp. A5 TaxID=2880263 RepID=UPI0020A639ED|nr:hemolysin family protein [Halobacillus sp. A5]MCP3026285.1 hemolysin family protein [Halobacillus sp. A5]
MQSTINLLAVALLIILTAFFVASEFAIVKVRRSKLESKADAGDKKSRIALKLVDNLDDYLSACQLGITITALGLGWLGEPTLEHILQPVVGESGLPDALSHTITFALAFSIITFLHVVLGELAPKTVAIQKAEPLTLLLARPLIFFHKIMYPFIFVLNGSANALVRLFGLATARESGEVHSEEELKYILNESFKEGEINRNEYRYVNRIFEFDNRMAKEIMVPRTEMVALDTNDSMRNNIRIMKQNRYTRYPVIDDDKDRILGIIHMKEFFYDDIEKTGVLKPYIKPVLKVFENIAIQELLVRMQKDHTHLAILIDEYGGTSGLVTIEDIIEEIVGEIRDEFDHEEEREIKTLKNGHFLIDGKTSIQDINDYFNIELDHYEVDTISGWIYTHDIDAKEGTLVEGSGIHFKIVDMDKSTIRKIEAWI